MPSPESPVNRIATRWTSSIFFFGITRAGFSPDLSGFDSGSRMGGQEGPIGSADGVSILPGARPAGRGSTRRALARRNASERQELRRFPAGGRGLKAGP